MTKKKFEVVDKDVKYHKKSVDYHIKLENGEMIIINRWKYFSNDEINDDYEIIEGRKIFDELPIEEQEEIIDVVLKD